MCVDPCPDPARAPRAGELFDPDGVVHVSAALAAVLDRELEPEETELAAAAVELAWELARRLPLIDVGGDLADYESAHGLPQLLVLLGEGRQRCACPGVLDRLRHN
jgi:hypothetical protein